MDVHGCSVIRAQCFHCGVEALSLFGELRSLQTCSGQKNKVKINKIRLFKERENLVL